MHKATSVLVLVSAGLLGACANPTPYLDAHFGEAVTMAKARQTLNPDASRSTDPVTGIDGPAAKQSIDRYQDTFKAPAHTFNVLGTTSGGSQ